MSEQNAKDGEARSIALSALQHYSYCPRQCALIHLEQAFEENVSTLRGQAVHRLVDEPESDFDRGVRIERALPLYSEKLGLSGKADVVEFEPDGTPYPVEYKHGRRHAREHDDIQVAAQALCLEEMTGLPVPKGATYHFSSRRRREVEIDDKLRRRVIDILEKTREMLESGTLPAPVADVKRCRNCSLIDLCQPDLARSADKLQQLRQTLFTPEDDT